MININIIIFQALNDIGVPVFFQEADEGTDYPYITFFEYNTMGNDYADDKEQFRQHSIQVDIWTKDSYVNLAKEVERSLGNTGFGFLNSADFYEKDVKVYHKGMRFFYLEERNDVNESNSRI